MPLAAIDFGTNSLRLLIADVTQHETGLRILPVYRCAQINQLGYTLHANKRIATESIARSKKILAQYIELITQHNCAAVSAVATSVFRDSPDGEMVKKVFEEQLGTSITILSGTQEAHLFFDGVCANRTIEQETHYGCVDIGGGSTEYIIAQGSKITQCDSLPMGCLRTKHAFFRSDPPTAHEISLFTDQIHDIMQQCTVPNQPVDSFFAFGGTITCLARIISEKKVEQTEGIFISKKQLHTVYTAISSLSDSEIGIQYGNWLDKGRETVLRAGTLITLEIMNSFHIDTITVTNQGILFGALKQLFQSLQSR